MVTKYTCSRPIRVLVATKTNVNFKHTPININETVSCCGVD